MRTDWKFTIAVLSVLVFASGMTGQDKPPNGDVFFTTGNDLYAACTDTGFANGMCYGYVSGVYDLIADLQHARFHDPDTPGTSVSPLWKMRNLCMNTEITKKQVVDVTVKYLTEHPEHRDKNAAGLIIISAIETFGCPQMHAN
jgi:hypothetical protein